MRQAYIKYSGLRNCTRHITICPPFDCNLYTKYIFLEGFLEGFFTITKTHFKTGEWSIGWDIWRVMHVWSYVHFGLCGLVHVCENIIFITTVYGMLIVSHKPMLAGHWYWSVIYWCICVMLCNTGVWHFNKLFYLLIVLLYKSYISFYV
jgi:hypothetical protein